MTSLMSLWLPILVSAVFVFIASSIIHMVLPWHRNDYRAMPDETRVMEALRPFAIPPGDYMVPCPANPAEMRSAAFMEKARQGPVMVATVMPNGMMNMTMNLVLWFIYSLVVSLFAAYIASRALAPGAPYLSVYRFSGATAFVGYSLGLWQMSIWYQRSWSTTFKSTIDGLIYAGLTAGTFGWLWPT